MKDSKLYLSVTGATKYLNDKGVPVCRATVYKWLAVHGIGRLIGGRWFVRKHKLQEWLDEEPQTVTRIKSERNSAKPRRRKVRGGKRGHRIYKKHNLGPDPLG